ncbi:tetratricopeptide repeat protein, partial [Candidatus Poribacteria bacterium]|nr:tetratricopeptide repeat protein [Candidatus Poribacteria bacterium]
MSDKLLVGVGVAALLGVLFWPSGSSQRVRTAFEEAEQYLAGQRYQEAIEQYEAALEESVKPFVKTEVIDPDFKTLANYKIAFANAQIADQTDDVTRYDAAVTTIEDIYRDAHVPKHRELITFLWGYVLFKQKKFDEADPKFRELIDNFPNSLYLENAWYSIGQLNFELVEYDRARVAYAAIVDGFPNSEFRDDSQHLIAQTFLLEQNYEQAFREFDNLTPEAFASSPLIPEADYKAAYCLLQLSRLEEAIDRYNRFVADHPNSGFVTAAYFDLGTIYTRQKDYDNAIQNYQLAIENTDNMALRAEIQYEIGDNYIEAGDFPSAADAYRTVVELYPESGYVAAARYGIGEAYLKYANANSASGAIDVESYDNAIAAYLVVLNEDPLSEYVAHATFQIAESYYQMQTYESALEWYRNLMDRHPDDPLAPYALYGELWSLSELQRYEEVLERGRSFVDAHIDDEDFDLQASEIQMKLGDIMFEQERFAVAAQEYGRVLDFEDLPKFYAVKLRSLYQVGVSHFRIGERDNDLSSFEKAVAPLATAIADYSDDVYNLDYEFPERLPLLENSILNKANVHEKLSQWGDARAAYALIPPMSENFGRAAVLTAETFEKEKSIDEAINHYAAIADNDALGETWQSLGAIRLADLLRGQERWTEAAVAYANIVERYPGSDYVDAAQYLIGVCFYSIEPRTAENLGKSVEAFSVVVDTSPDSENAPDALYGLTLSTKALADTGDATWEEVVALADKLTNDYSDRPDDRAQKAVNSGNLLRVLALEKLGHDVDEVIPGLRQVVASDSAEESTRVTAQLKIGNMLFGEERFAEAAPEYQALGDLFPTSDQAPLGYYQAAVSAYKHGEMLIVDDENAGAPWFAQAEELSGSALAYRDRGKVDDSLMVSINYTRGLAQSQGGRVMPAIQSLGVVTSFEGTVTDPDKLPIIEAAHIELARLNQQIGQFDTAATEYQYLAEHSTDSNMQLRSYLSLADIYENQLGDRAQAVANYSMAAEVGGDSDFSAQALYRAGVLLTQAAAAGEAGAVDEAIAKFEALQTRFANSTSDQVQLMVADGGVRASDLYVQTGNIDTALAKAEDARDRSVRTGDVVQKVQAQYQVANLRSRQARALFDNTEGSANTAYKQASRESVQDYLKVAEFAEPIAQAPQNARVFVGPALYQAGVVSYAVHGPVDLPISAEVLPRFVQLSDNGHITASAEEIQTALYYAGVTMYDLARGS